MPSVDRGDAAATCSLPPRERVSDAELDTLERWVETCDATGAWPTLPLDDARRLIDNLRVERAEHRQVMRVVRDVVAALERRDDLPMTDLYMAIDLAVRGKQPRIGWQTDDDAMSAIWRTLLVLVALAEGDDDAR